MTKVQSDDMEPNNSLLPTEMLEHLLGFLPFDSLRSSRLVNPNWAKAATVLMRKKSAPLSFRSQAETEGLKEPSSYSHEDLKRFVACCQASNGNFPVSKFEVTLSPYDRRSDATESNLHQFFEAVSPIVTELGLTFNLGRNLPKKWPGNFKYPKLTSFNLKVVEYVTFQENFLIFTQEIFDFIEGIIGQAPRLKMVSLELGDRAVGVGCCLDAISGREGLLQKITHLHLDLIHMRESGFSKLNSFHGLKLKAVKLSGRRDLNSQATSEILKRFLESQADSVRTLEIQNPEKRPDDWNLNVPKLRKLEYLKIGSYICIEGLSTKNFAALKRLHIDSPSPSLKALIMTSKVEPFGSVEELIISDMRKQTIEIEESGILWASRHFPNVTKLGIIPLSRKMLLAVCHGFPNLVELQLRGLESEGADSIITGLSKEQLKAAEMEMEAKGCLNEVYWRRQLDASKSIAFLHHLKVLSLLQKEGLAKLAKPLEFGFISSFVLKSMESLNLLHLGIRRFPPSDKHTNNVLRDLRKKIRVVYYDERTNVWVKEESDDDDVDENNVDILDIVDDDD